MTDKIIDIVRGSNFMFWASLKIDDNDPLFNFIPNADVIKNQMRNLHLYEVKGIADKYDDTLHITSDVFINHARLMEIETSISHIIEEPEEFVSLIEHALTTAIKFLKNNLIEHVKKNGSFGLFQTFENIDFDNLIEKYLYIWDETENANQAAEDDADTSSEDITPVPDKVNIQKYEIKNANPNDESDIQTIARMMDHIYSIVFTNTMRGELFIVEIKYLTTDVAGGPLEATTILDSEILFNSVHMLGAFSYRNDNIIILKPEMREYISKEYDDVPTVYCNEVVTNHVYTALDFLRKVKDMNSSITISVKGGIKGEEDFWNYV